MARNLKNHMLTHLLNSSHLQNTQTYFPQHYIPLQLCISLQSNFTTEESLLVFSEYSVPIQFSLTAIWALPYCSYHYRNCSFQDLPVTKFFGCILSPSSLASRYHSISLPIKKIYLFGYVSQYLGTYFPARDQIHAPCIGSVES